MVFSKPRRWRNSLGPKEGQIEFAKVPDDATLGHQPTMKLEIANEWRESKLASLETGLPLFRDDATDFVASLILRCRR
jgi:hypothetical protein